MLPIKGTKLTQHVLNTQTGYAPYKAIKASTKCSTASHVAGKLQCVSTVQC